MDFILKVSGNLTWSSETAETSNGDWVYRSNLAAGPAWPVWFGYFTTSWKIQNLEVQDKKRFRERVSDALFFYDLRDAAIIKHNPNLTSG